MSWGNEGERSRKSRAQIEYRWAFTERWEMDLLFILFYCPSFCVWNEIKSFHVWHHNNFLKNKTIIKPIHKKIKSTALVRISFRFELNICTPLIPNVKIRMKSYLMTLTESSLWVMSNQILKALYSCSLREKAKIRMIGWMLPKSKFAFSILILNLHSKAVFFHLRLQSFQNSNVRWVPLKPHRIQNSLSCWNSKNQSLN